MMRRNNSPEKLSEQVERKVSQRGEDTTPQYDGTSRVVSTGSTLLDLAISGGRFREGGIPTGILVEGFGPSGSGKTVLLCQIAGNVQKLGGKIMFHDPEARLNKQFASMFGLDPEKIDYTIPSTIPEVFKSLRDWIPEDAGSSDKPIYGVFADSLAALSTDMEMERDEGDRMGMRRAKEFSEELRKTCRIITQKDVLVVCSNQIRQNPDAGPYGQKYKSPGGEAIGFYASLRLRFKNAEKLKVKRTIKGQEHERVFGVKTEIEVSKSSVWKPFRTAEVYILFDYGIDDVRANLRYLKTNTGNSIYQVGDYKLGKSLETAIREVEERGLERELKDEIIGLWNEIEAEFEQKRKPRQ
jgi:RecA/RadA recombinase